MFYVSGVFKLGFFPQISVYLRAVDPPPLMLLSWLPLFCSCFVLQGAQYTQYESACLKFRYPCVFCNRVFVFVCFVDGVWGCFYQVCKCLLFFFYRWFCCVLSVGCVCLHCLHFFMFFML